MAAIASTATGLWSATGTWAGGVVPGIADTVTVTHTVTLDGTCDCSTLTVTSPGKIEASQSVSSSLRHAGNVVLNTGTYLRVDLSAYPSLTFTKVSNQGNGTNSVNSKLRALAGSALSLKGAFRKRVTLAQGAIAASASGTTTFDVDDATGWAVGDKLILVTTQSYTSTTRNDYVVISAISGNTVSINCTTTPIVYSKLDRCYVGNYSSNVSCVPYTAARSNVIYMPLTTAPIIPSLLQDVAIEIPFGTYDADGYGLTLNQGYSTTNSFDGGAGIVNNAFYVTSAQPASPFAWASPYTSIPRIDNLFVGSGVGANQSAMGFTDIANHYRPGPDTRPVVFGAGGFYNTNTPFGGEVVDGIMAGMSPGAAACGMSNGVKFTRCKLWSLGSPGVFSGNGIGVRFDTCEFEVEYPSLTRVSALMFGGGGMMSELLFDSCSFNAATGPVINSNANFYTVGNRAFFRNKNRDTNLQEAYTAIETTAGFGYEPTFKRDTGVIRRGDASIKVRARNTTYEPTHSTTFLALPGVTYKLLGSVQYDNAAGTSVPPRISVTGEDLTVTGTGVSGGVYTCPAGVSTWNQYDIDVSHGNAFATTVTVSYGARSSSSTLVNAYFDGVYDYPWVQRVRHYGYLFDDQPYRTVNPVIVANEATAIGYTGVTINSATPQITVGAGTANTFLKVYQYIQAWACLNIGEDVLLTSTDGNNFVADLTCKIDWAGMGADGTLIGGWLLLDTPGALNLSLSGTKIEFQTAGTYDMSGTSFSGTVELVNSSGGAVIVAVPGGTSYTNTGPSITVSAPTVTQGLGFTGLVAGSQVVVYATGTQTELFRDDTSSTSETWSQAGGSDTTVDYTVQKAGYIPIRVTGVTVNAAVLPTPVQQVVDRAYSASSGLAFGSTATVNTGTSRFTVTVATTVQNWYSYMVESWIAQSALRNVQFPLSSNGPNSFTSEAWEFSAGLSYLYRDGLRYTSAGVATAIYAGIYSVDTASGLQVKYQQTDGGTTTSAATTGKIDQLVQVYGDAGHGNFDRRTFLSLKVQADGYDQAETDVVATYGTLEDQLYVIGLNPVANGLPTGAPTVNGSPTITDHGASPVTWHSKAYSVTITDSAAGNTGETLMRWIRYNLAAGGTFQGKDAFNWHDLVQTNGSAFKTVRGAIYGDTGAALKGVRVITNAGDDHPDFTQHTADDGTSYVPVFPANAVATVLADTRVQLYNVTTAAEIDNQFVAGTSYSYTVVSGVTVGDTLRLRVCKMGYESAEAVGLWTATGLTFLVSQSADLIYDTWGIDGSTVTEFVGDVSGHIYIDSNDLDGETQKTRLGAWYSYYLTTATGIAYFYDGITFLSPAQIRINADVANILIENVNATTALTFTDTDVRLYRSDGETIIAPTSYSLHNDYSGVPDYSVVTVGGVNVITGDVSDVLAAIPSASSNATAVLVAAAAAPIASDVKKVNAQTISGTGSELDPWGP